MTWNENMKEVSATKDFWNFLSQIRHRISYSNEMARNKELAEDYMILKKR